MTGDEFHFNRPCWASPSASGFQASPAPWASPPARCCWWDHKEVLVGKRHVGWSHGAVTHFIHKGLHLPDSSSLSSLSFLPSFFSFCNEATEESVCKTVLNENKIKHSRSAVSGRSRRYFWRRLTAQKSCPPLNDLLPSYKSRQKLSGWLILNLLNTHIQRFCRLPWKQGTCTFIMYESVQEREILRPDRIKASLSDAIELWIPFWQ